ncbi:MAG: R3H domain-containing nucleic acid-binding protein [Actinomycetota bacterium]
MASGTARALEPMPSSDRKIIHDALTGRTDIGTHSEGEDPYRRVVITPAAG